MDKKKTKKGDKTTLTTTKHRPAPPPHEEPTTHTHHNNNNDSHNHHHNNHVDEKGRPLTRSLSIKSNAEKASRAVRSVKRSISTKLMKQPAKGRGGNTEEEAKHMEEIYGELSPRGVMDMIDLSSNGLDDVPEDIWHKADAKVLNLGNNHLTTIPTDLADSLKQLTILVVNDNLLRKLPKSLGKLQELKVLDLRRNQLFTLPSTLKKLQNLQKLFLQANKFANFPSSICGMTALQHLHLDHNNILTVPKDIQHLVNLEVLEMNYNYIRFLPKQLWKLQKLKSLKLNHNQIESVPDKIEGLASLTSIGLGHNCFKQFPAGLFTVPKSLTDIDLEGNKISAIPPEIEKLVALNKLNLAGNQLSDLPNEFKKLKSLTALDLRGNPLVGLAFGRGNWKTVLIDLTALKNLQTGQLPKNSKGTLPLLGSSLGPRKGTIDLSTSSDLAIPDEIALRLPLDARAGAVSTMPALRAKKGRPGLEGMFASEDMPLSASNAKGKGNSFDLFMQMSMNGGGGESESKEPGQADKEDLKKLLLKELEGGEKEEPPKEEPTAPAVETPQEEEEEEEEEGEIEINYVRKDGIIVQDFGAVDDMNKAGITRAKKDVIQQEDAHCEHYPLEPGTEIGLFCVFDGHGGKEASNAATTIFPKEFKKLVKKHGLKRDASNLLHTAFLTTDEKLREYQYEGCTATVAVVWKHKNHTYLQAANVGDSYAYVNQGKRAILLSQEHKLTSKHEQTRMEGLGISLNEGQTRIAGGLGVTRALGDHFAKDNNSGMVAVPFISEPVKLGPKNAHLIVASDGLWDVMTGKFALEMANKAPNAKEAADTIVKAALKNKDCKDNISVTVVRM